MEVFKVLPLLIVVLLIALAWWGARRFTRNNGPEGSSPTGQRPYGVHGVLAFFVFVSYYVAPIVGLGGIAKTFQELETASPAVVNLNGYGTYKAISFLIGLGVICWQIWVAHGLRHRFVSRSLTHAKLVCFLAPLAVMGADVVMAAVIFGVRPDASVFTDYGRAIAVSWIWGLYFVRSKRCRNTYAPSGASTHEGSADGVSVEDRLLRAAVPNTDSRRAEAGSVMEVVADQPTRQDVAPSSEGSAGPVGPVSGPTAPDERLQAIAKMQEAGLISREEFDAKRRQILDGI